MPSITEDLFAIGAGATIVGVSTYSDFPPEAKWLPVVADFASIDAERIVHLRPDVVIGIESQSLSAAEVRKAGLRTVLLKDDGFEDIFRDIESLGLLTGRVDAARALNDRMRARTTALLRSVHRGGHVPRVFVVLGVGPIYTVGASSYIAKMIDLAGGKNAAAINEAYGAYSAEALVAAQPDVLVADPTVQLQGVLDRAPWSALRAVREGRVAILPDPAILERPGPRYNDGLAWLIATLNAAHV